MTPMPSFADDDPFFRSHFAHVNRLADRSYDQVRDVYLAGYNAGYECPDGHCFEDVEKDLEGGWLNVRVGAGDWASVREFARVGFDRARQGRIANAPPADAGDRPPYADPLGGAIDPTQPSHPERL
ncbi:MAG: hypothetical protein ACREPM_17660 [Gemmatimonadaceae bacterium]